MDKAMSKTEIKSLTYRNERFSLIIPEREKEKFLNSMFIFLRNKNKGSIEILYGKKLNCLKEDVKEYFTKGAG